MLHLLGFGSKIKCLLLTNESILLENVMFFFRKTAGVQIVMELYAQCRYTDIYVYMVHIYLRVGDILYTVDISREEIYWSASWQEKSIFVFLDKEILHHIARTQTNRYL